MTTINNNYNSGSATQSVTTPSSGTVVSNASSNSAAYLVEMLTDLVMGLESQSGQNSVNTATVLPDSGEPTTLVAGAGSTATATSTGVDPDALALMGDAVGVGMATASTPVNWNDFVNQTGQAFGQAGFSQTDIDTYLGAVMQGYTQAAGNNASNVSSFTASGTSSGTILQASSSYLVPRNGLPSNTVDSSQFTALAQSTYNLMSSQLGDSVNINLFVANTQAEMATAGYSQDQITNYMTGLYEAYNGSAAGTLPAGTGTSSTVVPQPYNPQNPDITS